MTKASCEGKKQFCLVSIVLRDEEKICGRHLKVQNAEVKCGYRRSGGSQYGKKKIFFQKDILISVVMMDWKGKMSVTGKLEGYSKVMMA